MIKWGHRILNVVLLTLVLIYYILEILIDKVFSEQCSSIHGHNPTKKKKGGTLRPLFWEMAIFPPPHPKKKKKRLRLDHCFARVTREAEHRRIIKLYIYIYVVSLYVEVIWLYKFFNVVKMSKVNCWYNLKSLIVNFLVYLFIFLGSIYLLILSEYFNGRLERSNSIAKYQQLGLHDIMIKDATGITSSHEAVCTFRS